FFFSSRRRHTRFSRDWSSDVCSSDLARAGCSERFRRTVIPERSEKAKTLIRQDSHCVRNDKSELSRGSLGRVDVAQRTDQTAGKIGRASCRERVESSVGDVSVQEKER